MRAWLVIVALLGCRGDDAIEAALLARGPVPVLTSRDGGRVLLEVPRRRGVRYEVRARGALVAAREGEPMVAPVWRGDGAAIAYFAAQRHHHAYELRVWELGGEDRAVGAPITPNAFARFAPDGRIAYLADRRVLTVAGRGLIRVADRAEAEWSPDGARIATVSAAGDLSVVEVATGAVRAVHVIDGELQDLAWAPGGDRIAVTGRARGAAWFSVYLVRLADGAIEALPTGPGDVHAPSYVDGALAYHVERDGERQVIVAGRPVGSPGARLMGLAGASPDGARGAPVLLYRPRTGPAYLAGDAPIVRGAAATRIAIPGRDGAALPAYLWRAERARGAVVIVHGGPALHATPAWHERTQLLVDAGLHVVKLDYRGSTGHGAAFEALGAPDPLPGRIADVTAARDWASRALGLPADRVIVVGESYGAGLVAASDVAAASPVVLISTQPLATSGAPARCAVRAFHGDDDDVAPPGPAREALVRRFGAGVRWRLLPEEGHNVASVASWAVIYREILALRC
jgi:dipeptidyl aminopeptidase/acylaminoacyl peptidase